MIHDSSFAGVPADLAAALADQGFSTLTAVQVAVIAPELRGRDLRMSSQTGSGKTVAIGLAVADELGVPERPTTRRDRTARPAILIVTPTRELAAQVGRELGWLFAPRRARVEVVTGGTSVAGERRALASAPAVVVGTPGRLGDHIARGALDLSEVRAVVLDEADEMLDLGFRDDIEQLLGQTPDERRTHLVSATFSREVLRLASKYQRDAVQVAGTPIGAANDDIDHVGMLVRPGDRLDALVNLLLLSPDEQTLVFVRTRVATTGVASELTGSGFRAAALSGELSQRERTSTLDAFARGRVRILVATDVAARGLDLRDVTRVVHFDLPDTAEGFTHRSGRTGRAGNKGESLTFAAPSAKSRVERLTRSAGVRLSWRPMPTADQVRRAADDRLVTAITAGDEDRAASTRALAERLLAAGDAVEVVAALLERSAHTGPCAPREIQPPRAPAPREGRPERGPRPAHRASAPSRGPAPARGRGGAANDDYTTFRVSWGASQGADPRRLLAMICRRGGVRGGDIGQIRVGPHRSIIDVASHVADDFARAVRRPDPRNPAIAIHPLPDDVASFGGQAG